MIALWTEGELLLLVQSFDDTLFLL